MHGRAGRHCSTWIARSSMRIWTRENSIASFVEFVALARELGIQVEILSDGLDYAIHKILARYDLDGLPVTSNKLDAVAERRWKLAFPNASTECRVASGTCKCACSVNARSCRQAGVADRRRRVGFLRRPRRRLRLRQRQTDRALHRQQHRARADHGFFRRHRVDAVAHRWQLNGQRTTHSFAGYRLSCVKLQLPVRPVFSNVDRDAALLADEAKYCSFGDTVHYSEPPKIFDALRRQLSVRRPRHAVPRSADVVFGGQFRLRQPAPQRRVEAPDRHAAASRQPISASDQDRARQSGRAGREEEMGPQRPRAFQRRRLAGGRRFAQARAQCQQRQKPDVRVRRRLSRPHARRLGDHLVAIAIAAATAISATARSSSSSRITSAARKA